MIVIKFSGLKCQPRVSSDVTARLRIAIPQPQELMYRGVAKERHYKLEIERGNNLLLLYLFLFFSDLLQNNLASQPVQH